MSDKNEDSEVAHLNLEYIKKLLLENKEIDTTEKTIIKDNITLIRKDVDNRKSTRNTGTNNTDFNNGVAGVYLFRNFNYDTIYGTKAYKDGDFDFTTMKNNYGFINDDCSAVIAFNDNSGHTWDIKLYENDYWDGRVSRLKSDGTYDSVTRSGYRMNYGYWVGNGWTKIYCGSPAFAMNDTVSSMRVSKIDPVITVSQQSNLTTTEGNSRFYTRINGVDYNIDALVRQGANNSSKDKFIHNSGGYFAGESNSSSNIYDQTLLNYNNGTSIDYLASLKFKHDNNSGLPDLGNYFGAPYGDYNGYSYAVETIPAWCNRVICICVGAGGGGGAGRFGDNDGQSGGGGGSGGAVCAYIDCNGNEQIIISAGSSGKNNNWEGANGNQGGSSYVNVGNSEIVAYGGGGGFAGNKAGGGGSYYTTGASVIKYHNGNSGTWGANADDDDDEMNSNWEGYRAPGASSIYNWTASGNGKGSGGNGGHFGDDDEFDGDYGSNGGAGFVRVYYIRK